MWDQLHVVALDAQVLSDVAWTGRDRFKSFVLYDATAPDALIERAKDAEVLLTNKVRIGAAELEKLPKLRYIGVLATGYDVVDIAAARARGIPVTNVPAYASYSVAQLVFALLFELTYRIGRHHQTVAHEKKWSDSPVFSYWEQPLMELSGKTMGIVGMGQIGERVGLIARAFGMNVMAHDLNERPTAVEGLRYVPLDVLLAQSDVVSLHCPLFEGTRGMIDKAALSAMKRSAYLINTSRGPLVAESDLRWALDEGVIAGAGLDVLEKEPPAHDNPLFAAPNCVITPHIGWATVEARTHLVEVALDNIAAFFAGAPVNVVNA